MERPTPNRTEEARGGSGTASTAADTGGGLPRHNGL